jgi:protein-tyrosine phosphatase
VNGVVDFHNHLMPGVDDGAQDVAETEAGLNKFKADGVATVIATPHLDGSMTTHPGQLADRLEELDIGFADLKACAEKVGGMRVERGVELLLDVPEPDISDPRLRLAGGNFFLMEFPFMSIPPHSARVVRQIVQGPYRPIIAHPERYNGFLHSMEQALEWKEAGALLQVNGGSLLGRYGKDARAAAFELLARGWVDYVCSDFHTRGPALVADYCRLLEEMAPEQAYLLTVTNPGRILTGEAPIPIAPLKAQRPGMWGRVTSIFKSRT